MQRWVTYWTAQTQLARTHTHTHTLTYTHIHTHTHTHTYTHIHTHTHTHRRGWRPDQTDGAEEKYGGGLAREPPPPYLKLGNPGKVCREFCPSFFIWQRQKVCKHDTVVLRYAGLLHKGLNNKKRKIILILYTQREDIGHGLKVGGGLWETWRTPTSFFYVPLENDYYFKSTT